MDTRVEQRCVSQPGAGPTSSREWCVSTPAHGCPRSLARTRGQKKYFG